MERLRKYIPVDSPEITDDELDELSTLLDFDSYFDRDLYEYAGNFIITKDCADRDQAVCGMCCGIVQKDVLLSNGEVIYFAFDYGH